MLLYSLQLLFIMGIRVLKKLFNWGELHYSVTEHYQLIMLIGTHVMVVWSNSTVLAMSISLHAGCEYAKGDDNEGDIVIYNPTYSLIYCIKCCSLMEL